MRIDILTLFPEMFEGVFSQSILKRAVAKGHLELHTHDIRDYTKDKYGRTDTPPIGGGAGLIEKAQPIVDAIRASATEESKVIMMSPRGVTFNQAKAKELESRIEDLERRKEQEAQARVLLLGRAKALLSEAEEEDHD